MKSILLLAACFGILVLLATTQAYPQRVYVQKLPYYPPPTRQPVIQRAKREVTIQDSVAKAPNGGADVLVKVTKTIGNDNAKAAGSVFAAGNTNGGAFTKGATLGAAGFNDKGELTKSLTVGVEKTEDAIRQSFTKQAEANLRLGDHNSLTGKVSQTDTKISGIDFKPQFSSASFKWKNDNGIAASISRDVNRGVGSELTKSLSANLFDTGKQRLDGSLFHTKVSQSNGFNFDKTGGALDYSHINGHGLTAGLTRFSGVGDQASLSARTNLFRSNDGLSNLNANFGGSKWLNGPFTSQRDYNFGLGYSYNGWRG